MAADVRHTATRTCVACRTRRDKAEFVRVVRRPDGTIDLDPSGRLDGRGAYLCADGSCWAMALKRSSLQRALRSGLPDDIRTRLEQGDVAAVRDSTDHEAPEAIQGGTHGA